MKRAILGTVAAMGFAGIAYGDEITITGDSITVINEQGEVVAEGDATIVIEGDGQIAVEGDGGAASGGDGAASAGAGTAATEAEDGAAMEAGGEAGGAETAEGETAAAEIPVGADIAAGEEAYQGVCRNCHGPKAQGIASYPRLSDKDFAYIVDRLETYRAGERVGPNSMLMIPHAKPLSDEEIVNLSAYVTTAFD